MKSILMALSLFLTIILLQNCGQFDSQLSGFEQETLFTTAASFSKPYQILHVKDEASRRLDHRFSHDFNKDGVRDLLDCRLHQVVIKDGKNLNRHLFNWQLPNPTINHGTFAGKTKLHVTSCSVVRIKANHPSVVISSAYGNPAVGLRIPAVQYILYNKGETKSGGTLRVTKQTVAVNQEKRNFNFRSAARSVKCTEFPTKLVKKGYSPGALCFYAGNDGPITRGGSGTNTALIKFEVGKNGKAAAIDMTVDSNLPWYGGALGTPLEAFSTFEMNGGRKYDGLSMMDGAFLDYNSDGLPDLVTVGQHSSIRLSTMRFDSKTREGIAFRTTKILQAKDQGMTEFLRVQSINEFDGSIGYKCILVSGEAPNVYDHIWCYHGNSWVKYPLPMRMSRGIGLASITRQAKNSFNIKFRAHDQIRKKKITFMLRKTPGRIDGSIGKISKTSKGLRVTGWACQKAVEKPLTIHAYVGKPASGGGTLVNVFKTNKRAEKAIHQRCQAKRNFRFDIVIPKAQLKKHAGKKLYLHGIQIVKAAPGGNDLLNKSGDFKIPKF